MILVKWHKSISLTWAMDVIRIVYYIEQIWVDKIIIFSCFICYEWWVLNFVIKLKFFTFVIYRSYKFIKFIYFWLHPVKYTKISVRVYSAVYVSVLCFSVLTINNMVVCLHPLFLLMYLVQMTISALMMVMFCLVWYIKFGLHRVCFYYFIIFFIYQYNTVDSLVYFLMIHLPGHTILILFIVN